MKKLIPNENRRIRKAQFGTILNYLRKLLPKRRDTSYRVNWPPLSGMGYYYDENNNQHNISMKDYERIRKDLERQYYGIDPSQIQWTHGNSGYYTDNNGRTRTVTRFKPNERDILNIYENNQ